jgi:hypothetical protein
MKNANLRGHAAEYFPDFEVIIGADSASAIEVWESDLTSGKALEFLSMITLLNELASAGANISIDPIFLENPGLYYLRNEIPFHHGAQAGHDGSLSGEFSLANRFTAALLPRASFTIRGKDYMLYREGNPLHLIENIAKYNSPYKERPDLVLVEGNIDEWSVNNGKLSLCHKTRGTSAELSLSIKNSNLIPIHTYSYGSNYEVVTNGVVECSVSKTRDHIDKQLDQYSDLFSSTEVVPTCLFIHGKSGCSKYDTVNIETINMVGDLQSPITKSIISQFWDDALV